MGLIVDNFAGGGGASLGIERALGRSPDYAINHDPEAIAMHQVNHPSTEHLCGDVWDVRPRELCSGHHVSLAWFSPDCKHFSRAKGGKPVDKSIRGLAWVVTRWANDVRPDVIILENVEEFETWGPLGDDNRPDPLRRGLTFRRWLGRLRNLGYDVEWRSLRACDYGAPTTRKRLFLIARCDGQPIVWPAPTHTPDRYRTAAECIDWSVPAPSIFDRKRPLADKTLARIARGIRKYVLEHADPFVLPVTHAGGPDRAHSIHEPLRTITGANRGEIALCNPTLIQTGYGEYPGQAPRTLDLHQPLGTIVAGGSKHALVAAFLAKHYGGHESPGADLRDPISTITARDHHAVVAVPLGTGGRAQEVRAFLTKFYGTSTGQSLKRPVSTVSAQGQHHGLVTVAGRRYEIADIGMRMLTPHELYRAQGFTPDYRIDFQYRGKPLTKTAQVKMCGNSVSPPVAEALVRANCAGLSRGESVAA